jgi:hypothetical protein
VPRLPDLEHFGLVPSAHEDLLAVDRQRFPRAVVQRGGSIFGQPLQVQVLRVAADVRLAPRVVRRVPDDHARRARQGHPAHLEPRRRKVAFEPDRRQRRAQVGVVREERLAADGARPGHDPVVRSLALGREGGVPQDVERPPSSEPAAVLAGDDHRRVAADVREQREHGLVPEPLGDLDPQQLGVPVPREHPRHERGDRAAVLQGSFLVVERRGVELENLILDRRRRHRRHSGPVPRDHRPRHVHRPVVVRGHQPPARTVQPDRAEEPVDRHRELADQLGQPPGREAHGEVRLEQPLLGHDEPLREEQVGQRRREDVRDAPPVPDDLDRLPEAGHPELPFDPRQCVARLPHQHLGPIAHPTTGSSGIVRQEPPRYGPPSRPSKPGPVESPPADLQECGSTRLFQRGRPQ